MDSTQQWLDNAVAGNLPAGASSLRMEVTVGELDSRLRLAPCAGLNLICQWEPVFGVKPDWVCAVWRVVPNGMFFY